MKGALKNKCSWNSKTQQIIEKFVWRSSFLVNFQACRLIGCNFTDRWTPSQVFFNTVLSLPCSTHVFNQATPNQMLKSPPPCSQHLWETLSALPITEAYVQGALISRFVYLTDFYLPTISLQFEQSVYKYLHQNFTMLTK